MCDEVIIENVRKLGLFPDCCKYQKCVKKLLIITLCVKICSDCYKTQKMCNKAAGTYPSAIELTPKCYNSQEIFDKAVDTILFQMWNVH